jgi:hypothetical protein
VKDAIVDGEIVHLGPDGKPLLIPLLRRSRQHFYALTGRDLRAEMSTSG